MARSIILLRAERDIADLFEYHLDHSDRAANRFVDTVIAAVERLEPFPQNGSPKDELGEGMRAAVLREYRATLYYHVVEGEETIVTVLRVLRQERGLDPEMFSGIPE